MKARSSCLLAAGVFAVFGAWRVWRDLVTDRRIREQFQDQFVEIPGIAGARPVRMHALVRQDLTVQRPSIVLVHGYGIGGSYFLRLADVLADHADVYAPDLPGHGQSDHDAHPLTIVELAAALVAWMERLDLPPVLLVGHSMGCQVAAEAAVRSPQRVARLVLLGPTTDPATRSAVRLLAYALGTALFERPGWMLRGLLDYMRAGIHLVLQEMRHMLEHRLEDVLPAVRMPVLVARGRRDLLVSLSWADTLSRLSGAPAPVVLPGVGHVVQYADPRAVATVILQFAPTASAQTVERRGSGVESTPAIVPGC